MKQYVVECMGAFFLLLALATGDALAIGAMLTVLTYIGWHLSGAHYNPAMSTATYMITRVTTSEYCYYMGAQIAGTFLGAAFWYLVTGQQWIIHVSPAPLWLIILFEAVLTMLLCITFLTVIDLFQRRNMQEYGLIMGIGMAAVASLRGIANPAVVVGPLIFFMCMNSESMQVMSSFLGYIIGPFIGAWGAAQVHRYLHVAE